jgi:hypothetical protein
LTKLPKTLVGCSNLELLRVSLNQLGESPDWLFKLPRLAWYSDSGNPFSQNGRAALHNVREFAWSELQVTDVLGESSKNIVYRATMSGHPIAVKLFGAGVTTDGAPLDDMHASLIAGKHPSIIGGLGRVKDCPDAREGFTMPLVPSDYSPLGLPPDFTTLTRDVFAAGTTFETDAIQRALQDISAAMEHLSRRGIQHGDLYAHNILSRPDGKSYLCDFGAASLYAPGSVAGQLRERIEVRSFGYLLDDLLSHAAAPAAALVDLRDACLALNPSERPTFRELAASLAAA